MNKKQKYVNFLLLFGVFVLLLPFIKVLINPSDFIVMKNTFSLNGIQAFFKWFFGSTFMYTYYIIGGVLLAIGIYLDIKIK